MGELEEEEGEVPSLEPTEVGRAVAVPVAGDRLNERGDLDGHRRRGRGRRLVAHGVGEPVGAAESGLRLVDAGLAEARQGPAAGARHGRHHGARLEGVVRQEVGEGELQRGSFEGGQRVVHGGRRQEGRRGRQGEDGGDRRRTTNGLHHRLPPCSASQAVTSARPASSPAPRKPSRAAAASSPARDRSVPESPAPARG